MRGLYTLTDAVDRLLRLELTAEQRHTLATEQGWLFGAYAYARDVQERGGDLKFPRLCG